MTNDNSYTSPLVYVIAIFLAIHMFTFPFIIPPYVTDAGPSWHGLDVSWQMALNYANIHNWTWGKDISYTYGPLGFLSTRNNFGVSRWIFLAFDLLLVINFFYVFKDFLKASASKLLGTMILVVATLLMHTNHGTDLSWVVLFFIYFWLYKTYREPATASFIMLVVLTVLSLYIKVNTGIISICFFAAHLALLYFIDKISLPKATIIFSALLITILATAWLLNVHLAGYVRSAFEFIKGYNDTMYLDNGELYVENNMSVLYNMLKYLLIIYFIYLFFKGKFVQFFFIGISLAYIVLLKKQAYLRGDMQHLSEFFSYGPLVLLVGNLLYFKNNTQKLFSAAILFILTVSLFYKTEFGNKLNDLYKNRFTNKKEYFRQFSEHKDAQYVFQPEKRYIPDTILAKIGTNTIDVFPWDIEYLIENKLNYHPRPVIQSFCAFTEYLQEMNYNFYLNSAPRYILYDYETIDNRYALCDESKLSMYIIKNYRLTDTFTSNGRLRSVLEKRDNATPLVFDKIEERRVKLIQNIPLVQGADFIRVHIEQNLKGKKIAFSMRPPKLDIQFNTSDGKSYIYRTSPSLLKAGVIIENFISNHQDFISLLTQQEYNSKIINIKLLADESLFKDEFVVEYYKVKQ